MALLCYFNDMFLFIVYKTQQILGIGGEDMLS